jgi:hypothetical protein
MKKDVEESLLAAILRDARLRRALRMRSRFAARFQTLMVRSPPKRASRTMQAVLVRQPPAAICDSPEVNKASRGARA